MAREKHRNRHRDEVRRTGRRREDWSAVDSKPASPPRTLAPVDTETAPLIDARIDAFARRDATILSGIHWRVMPGQHWVVLGANGSGKSTLLKIVAGYEWPSRGRVSVLGQEYGKCSMPDVKRRIGLASAALYARFPPSQKAIDVVASGHSATIGAWVRFTPSDLEAAERALSQINADGCAQKPYGVLSQGEKQRVMIARALVHEPELLVLDEPCAGLDPGARESFLEDVQRLVETGPTLLLVTHHVEEIPKCVTHALVLHEGRTLSQGPCADVLTSDTLSTAFGIPCRLSCEDGRFSLRAI